jgi:hypothetical protein
MPRLKVCGKLGAPDAEPYEGGPYFWIAPWRTRRAPVVIAEGSRPWCSAKPVAIHGLAAGKADATHTFRKVRCPECGRRLQPMTVDCEPGYGDFYPLLPPHKIRKTKWKKPKDMRATPSLEVRKPRVATEPPQEGRLQEKHYRSTTKEFRKSVGWEQE